MTSQSMLINIINQSFQFKFQATFVMQGMWTTSTFCVMTIWMLIITHQYLSKLHELQGKYMFALIYSAFLFYTSL